MKLRAEHFPEHTDFVRRYKNHQVKLAFYPALSQFRFVINDYFAHGITFDGWEGILHLHLRLVVSGDLMMLQIRDRGGKEMIINDPLCANISVEGLDDDAVIDRLYKDPSDTIKDQRGLSVRQFVAERATIGTNSYTLEMPVLR